MPDPANTVVPPNVVIRINGNVSWAWRVASGGNYVAVCEPLRLTLQAPSWTELMDDICNTLNALVNDLLESNELDQFMQEHGWRTVSPIPARPTDLWFEVPFSIIPFNTAGAHGSQRHLPQ